MHNKVLDVKLFFYGLGKRFFPKVFVPKYYRNYMKRHFPQGEKYQFLAHREENQDFSRYDTDLKVIAYYLPQFHTFPENDAWWGKGFTEWTNTRSAKPRCAGHYQPREPHADIGYYDLSDINVMARQAALAKQHGIYGFCMYYYWFSGKKLMEKPLDNLMKHPEVDFPFCLCWANENWSRRWDGSEESVLIAQKYTPQDPLLFIQDVAPYLKDKRYIRVNGKPVLLVYKIQELPNPAEAFAIWRQWCRQNGIGEIEIWAVRTNGSFSYSFGNLVDREVEFPPHPVIPNWQMKQAIHQLDTWTDYKSLVYDIMHPCKADPLPDKNRPIVRSVMLAWDNTARHKNTKAGIYNKFSLYTYYLWLRYLIEYTRKHFAQPERFVFINAWNEWAEGSYLEPDRKYGYAYLNVTSRAIFGLPFEMPLEANAAVIVCLESLGDIIACEPVIEAVKKQYPGRPVYWVVYAPYADVLQGHPGLAGIVPVYSVAQWQQMKKKAPATIKVIDLHFYNREYLFAGGKVFPNSNTRQISYGNYYDEGQSLLDIFSKVAGLPSNNAAPHFYIAPFAKKPANLPARYIAVHTLSSTTQKDWSLEKWQELVRILKKHQLGVVEIGHGALLAQEEGCVNCTSLPSIHDTAAVLAGALAFVGVDSSMAHLANALGVPGVVLLGKYGNFPHYMPYSGDYQNGSNAVILRACHQAPAREIPVQDVWRALEQLLNRKAAKNTGVNK